MKRWFCMFAACMWMIPAAIAERTARTNDIYQETPYTLTIQGETYTGMAQVTRTFPEQMSRLIGKGAKGNQEEVAEDMFTRLGLPAQQMKAAQNPENSSHYYLGDSPYGSDRGSAIHFSGPDVRYFEQPVKMDEYWNSGVMVFTDEKGSVIETNTATRIYLDLDLDWRALPEIAGTGFPRQIDKVYEMVECAGMDAGGIMTLAYWDGQTLERNRQREMEESGAEYARKTPWSDADACVLIYMPVYVEGIPLQYESSGGYPDTLYHHCCGVEACVTQDSVVYISMVGRLQDLRADGQAERVLTPEEILARYEEYLNQLLAVTDEMREIGCIRLEYSVWNTLERGNFWPDIHLDPVWSIYWKKSGNHPAVVFDALTGEMIFW